MQVNPSDIDFSMLVEIPLYSCAVSAGQPSFTDDYLQSSIMVPAALGLLPETSFALVVAGDSMSGVGIVDRDIVFVHKSLEPVHGKIVVAAVNGEQTIKRLYRRNGQVKLLPENPDYQPIAIHPEVDLVIQGVVIGMYRPY
jgi:DNA polymerase V